jgi:periplasmic protein TonB
MRIGLFLGIVFAVILHVSIVLFGGMVFGGHKGSAGNVMTVEVQSVDAAAEKDKPKDKPKEETPAEKKDAMKTEEEQAPDSAELIRNLDLNVTNSAPALDTASLSEIEATLNGQSGMGGDFARAVDFGHGEIGGHGRPGTGSGKSLEGDNAFEMVDIDQKPQAIFKKEPVYPSSMRGKKTDGFVSVVFIVDESGKVNNIRIEKSSERNFEKAAVDAIRAWKFEPGLKGGQHVACKMRQTIRFPASGR